MVCTSVCTSQRRGKRLRGLPLFRQDVSLLQPKPCQEVEAIAASRLGACCRVLRCSYQGSSFASFAHSPERRAL